MKKIIILVLCMAVSAPVFAKDVFTYTGNFVGGVMSGAVLGADISKPEKNTARAACHIGMTSLMFLVSPAGALAYMGISGLISGVARTKTGEYPDVSKYAWGIEDLNIKGK